ncbi:C-type lectin [Penaeus vannamei]|uniref:C-type lectin n=1 Tax=Penaeus vannamei TaxID=6689 RepID=A0A423TJA8_PENVA|nr:C-type lectin domain family 4 member F-like [Penaeus vannamei]ROT76550.1 C-type lectin [Penaeus vannamei]
MMFFVLLLSFLPLLTGSPIPSQSPNAQRVCDGGFHNIYDHCIQFRTQEVSWYEGKNLCSNMGAKLAKVDDANFMYYLVKFIRNNGLDGYYYWIGASDEGHDGLFRWTDGTAVKMGTPFWGDSSDQVQEPDSNYNHNCVFLARHDHFFFFDYDCSAPEAIICEK